MSPRKKPHHWVEVGEGQWCRTLGCKAKRRGRAGVFEYCAHDGRWSKGVPPCPAVASSPETSPAAKSATAVRRAQTSAPRRLVSSAEGTYLPILLDPKQHARLRCLAKRSGVTVERWLDSVLASAMATDEQHWREVKDREWIMLSPTARRALAEASRAPIPRSTVNPGVTDWLLGRGLIELVDLPSPYKSPHARKGKVVHVRITEAGRTRLKAREDRSPKVAS